MKLRGVKKLLKTVVLVTIIVKNSTEKHQDFGLECL